MCFRQRPSRDVGSESVLNGDETDECLQISAVPKSSADDAMSCLLLKTGPTVESHTELCVHPLDLHSVPQTPVKGLQFRSPSIPPENSLSIVMMLAKSPNRTWCLQKISTTLHRLHRIHHEPVCNQTATLPVDLHYSNQALLLLSTVTNWNFNVFTLDTLTCGRPLFYIALHLFRQHNFIDYFHLDFVKLMNLFCMVEDGYHRSNPYHNAVHAADVTQAMNCFLLESKLSESLTPLERMSALLAALSHDIDHPGFNQSFLVATDNPLVQLYESTSVLENHHWRSLVCVLHSSHVFDHFDSDTWTHLKWQTRTQILATDITRQEDILSKLQKHLNAETLDLRHSELDRNFTLQIALKCADICNPCRPWQLSQRWGQLVCQEFFLQGDDERRLRLPVSKTCDRYTNSVVQVQSGFISYVVRPLFIEWQRLVCSPLSCQLLENLKTNLKRWNSVANEETVSVTVRDSSNDSTPTPSTGEPNQFLPASFDKITSHHSSFNSGPKTTQSPGDNTRDIENSPSQCSYKTDVISCDSLRRGSQPPPLFVSSALDDQSHRRNSVPVVDSNPSSTMRRCLLLTSLAENPPSVHILSPDTPSPPNNVSDSCNIAQLNIDDCDNTCLLLMQCNGRRGSAPAACVLPKNNTTSSWKPSSWRDNQLKSHSTVRSTSLFVETSSSTSARRSSNIVFPSDRRVVYMVAEGVGAPAVAAVTSSQVGKGWTRSRRSNSAHAIIFRPRFVAGRRCSSPAIGNKSKPQWFTDDLTQRLTEHMATDSGLDGHTNAYTLDVDLPIICRT